MGDPLTRVVDYSINMIFFYGSNKFTDIASIPE